MKQRTILSLVVLAIITVYGWPLPVTKAAPQNTGAKAVLDQINALRTDPANARATVDKMMAAAFPKAEDLANALKDKYGDKTRAQHLDDFVAFAKTQPKMAPLQWDDQLASIAPKGGKSNNKLFTPEHIFDTFYANPLTAFLSSLTSGIDFQYKPLFNPTLRYGGIAPKADKPDELQIVTASLPGRAYAMSDDDIGKNAYDPRLDNEPAWVFALFLNPPQVIPFAKADGTVDVAWRRLGDKQVFINRYGADGKLMWAKPATGVNAGEHSLLGGFTEDPQGNMYLVRDLDEPPPADNVNTPKPNPGNAFDRNGVVKVSKFDANAKELWTKNFDMKGGNATAYYSPLSANGKGTYGATSKIAFFTIKRAVYRLADDESIIVPASIAEQALLGYSVNRLGQKSPNRFAAKFQPTEAGGVIAPQVQLQFGPEYSQGKIWAATGEAGQPVDFFDGGSVKSYADVEYNAADYGTFNGFLDANKTGDKEFSIPPAKLKMKAVIEEVPLVFMIYGAATDFDPAINGRHQNAYWRAVDARTGDPAEDFNGGAMAHSFDMRTLVTDEGIITAERSDGFMLLSNYLQTRPGPVFLAAFNTVSNGNECYCTIGGLAQANDGYMFLYAANNSKYDVTANRDDGLTDAQYAEEEIRQRDLGVLRAKKGFAQATDAWRDKDEKVYNALLDSRKKPAEGNALFGMRPKYITSYFKDNQPYSAGRPKIVRVADGNYVVFWERWNHLVTKNADGKKELSGTYDSTWAMKIDQNGNTVKPAVKISDTLRLLRGDDPVLWGGKATFFSGDVIEGKMVAHTIDSELNYKAMPLVLN